MARSAPARPQHRRRRRQLPRRRDAGVKFALGSDVSLGTGLEIQQMIRHGHPRRGPDGRDQQRAQALGWLAEHIGAVAEGKVAGLLIAAGDPPQELHGPTWASPAPVRPNELPE
jgi:imidazolonepropionase-like amidohydrolase